MFGITKNKQKAPIDMLSGPILPLIIRLAIPVLLSSLMSWSFQAADMMVVGKFVSDDALAAVNAAVTPNALASGMIGLIQVGAGVVCAHAFGSRDKKRIKAAVHTSVLFGFILGIIQMCFSLAITDYMIDIMSVPDSIAADTSLYLKLYFIGSVPIRVYQYATTVLQVKGDVVRPTLYVVISGASNVALNLIFVLAFNMSVAGVALATTISNIIAAILSMRAVMTDKDDARIDIKKLRIDGGVLKEILRIGIPAALRGLLFTISCFFIDSAINSFDITAIISGHGAGGNIENMIRYFFSAVGSAAMVVTGQNYGAKNYNRMVKVLKTSIIIISVEGIILGGSAALLADKLLLAYVSSPEAIFYGATRMTFITAFCFFDTIVDVLTGFMQTCKYSLVPTVISLFSVCIFRTAWVFTAFKLNPTYEVLLACYPISYILSVTVLGIVSIFVLRKVKKKFVAKSELPLS